MKVGAIAYCCGPMGPLLCFVTSRRHKNALTLPKGIVRPGEKLTSASLRELFEEAGVKGKIRRKLRPMLFTSKDHQIDDVLYFFVEIKSVSKVWSLACESDCFCRLKMLFCVRRVPVPKKSFLVSPNRKV